MLPQGQRNPHPPSACKGFIAGAGTPGPLPLPLSLGKHRVRRVAGSRWVLAVEARPAYVLGLAPCPVRGEAGQASPRPPHGPMRYGGHPHTTRTPVCRNKGSNELTLPKAGGDTKGSRGNLWW